MPLPLILGIPDDPRGWDSFSFAHNQDHNEIQTAILKQKSVNLPVLQLFPVKPDDEQAFSVWLDLHQQAHVNMTSVLDIEVQDLTDLDPHDPQSVQEWLAANYKDHLNVRETLGI